MSSGKANDFTLEDESLRRKQGYKKLMDDGLKISNRAETDELIDTLRRVKLLLSESGKFSGEGRETDRTESSTEMVMDAQVIKMSHELVGLAVSKKGATGFSDTEYATALIGLLHSDGPTNWDILGDECVKIMFQSNYSLNTLGTFDPLPRDVSEEQSQRQKRQRNQLETEKRPDKLRKVDGEVKGMQKINVVMNQINNEYLKIKKPLPYYMVVIDPENFMFSVDNIFQVAFLANSGLISLEKGSDGLPTIVPVTKDDRVAFEQNNTREHAIVKLSPKIWKEMIKKYRITEPFLTYDRSDDPDS